MSIHFLIEGQIELHFPFADQGFDEYMNLVLDDAEEVNVKKKSRKTLGELWDWNMVLFFHVMGFS